MYGIQPVPVSTATQTRSGKRSCTPELMISDMSVIMSAAPTVARPVRSSPRTPFGFGLLILRITRTWKCTGTPAACAAAQNSSSSGRIVDPTLGMVFSHTPRNPILRQRSISRIAASTPSAGMHPSPIRRDGSTLTISSASQLL